MVSLAWDMGSMTYTWSLEWNSLQSLLAESGGEYGFQTENQGTAPRKMGELMEDTEVTDDCDLFYCFLGPLFRQTP